MDQQGSAYVNGVWSAPDDASVPVHDRGFLYGDGVFESLRTRDGIPVHLDAHLTRLGTGATALGIERVPDQAALADVVRQGVERAGLPDAYVRITLTRGGPPGFDPAGGGGPPGLVVTVLALPPRPHAGGARLALLEPAPVPADPPPGVKATGAFLRHTLGRLRARAAGADDGLWRDPDANVTEATTSNVFAVTDDVLHTPPATVCLPGITRGDVLRLAEAEAMTTITDPLPTAALLAADEVFLTNSVAGVQGVQRVGTTDFAIGPVTRRFAEIVAEIV